MGHRDTRFREDNHVTLPGFLQIGQELALDVSRCGAEGGSLEPIESRHSDKQLKAVDTAAGDEPLQENQVDQQPNFMLIRPKTSESPSLVESCKDQFVQVDNATKAKLGQKLKVYALRIQGRPKGSNHLFQQER